MSLGSTMKLPLQVLVNCKPDWAAVGRNYCCCWAPSERMEVNRKPPEKFHKQTGRRNLFFVIQAPSSLWRPLTGGSWQSWNVLAEPWLCIAKICREGQVWRQETRAQSLSHMCLLVKKQCCLVKDRVKMKALKSQASEFQLDKPRNSKGLKVSEFRRVTQWWVRTLFSFNVTSL